MKPFILFRKKLADVRVKRHRKINNFESTKEVNCRHYGST